VQLGSSQCLGAIGRRALRPGTYGERTASMAFAPKPRLEHPGRDRLSGPAGQFLVRGRSEHGPEAAPAEVRAKRATLLSRPEPHGLYVPRMSCPLERANRPSGRWTGIRATLTCRPIGKMNASPPKADTSSRNRTTRRSPPGQAPSTHRAPSATPSASQPTDHLPSTTPEPITPPPSPPKRMKSAQNYASIARSLAGDSALARFPKAQSFNNLQGASTTAHADYPNQLRPQSWTGRSVTH